MLAAGYLLEAGDFEKARSISADIRGAFDISPLVFCPMNGVHLRIRIEKGLRFTYSQDIFRVLHWEINDSGII